MYYRHIIIISCVDFESFFLTINFDVMLSSNIITCWIYEFICKFESIFSFHCKKKKNKVTYEGLFYQLFVLKTVYERKKGQLIKSLFSTSVYFFVRHGGV